MSNAEVELFLAKALGWFRSEVTLVRDASGRDKTILVRGGAAEEIRGVPSDQPA